MLRFIGSQREGTSFFRKIGLAFWSRYSEQLLAEMVRFSFCEDDPTGTLSILGEYFCPARISRQYLQNILRIFFTGFSVCNGNWSGRLFLRNIFGGVFDDICKGFCTDSCLGFYLCEDNHWPLIRPAVYFSGKILRQYLQMNIFGQKRLFGDVSTLKV